jgi:hypothetical protein
MPSTLLASEHYQRKNYKNWLPCKMNVIYTV